MFARWSGLRLTAARLCVSVVGVLQIDDAHEKKNKNYTERGAQHNYTHMEDHPQIVLHPIHHSTRTNSSLVATLHLFVVNLEVILSHCHPKCCHSRERHSQDFGRTEAVPVSSSR